MVRHFGPGEAQIVGRDGKVLFIHLRGRFRVTRADGSEVQISSKRSQALLAYLCLTLGFKATRRDIGQRLWGDDLEAADDDECAKPSGASDAAGGAKSDVAVQLKNLRQLLVTLRKQVGPDAARAIGAGNDAVWLIPSMVWVDVFDEAAAIGATGEVLPEWVLQTPPLLHGFALLGASFDEWLMTEARDYRARKGRALTQRAEAIERLAPPVDRMIMHFRSLFGCVPEDEDFCCRLMELLSTSQGSLKEITAIYRQCRAAVLADTGEPLQAETEAGYMRACALLRAQGREGAGSSDIERRDQGDWVPAECAPPQERPIRLDNPICIGVRPLHNLTGETTLDRLSILLNRNIMTDIGMLSRPFKLVELPPAGAPAVPRQSLCDYIVSTRLEIERCENDPQILINIDVADGRDGSLVRPNRARYPLAPTLDCRRALSAQVANKVYFDLITHLALRLEGRSDAELSVLELLSLGMAMLARRNTQSNVWAAMRYFGSALVRDGRNVHALAGAAHVYHRLATQPAFADNPVEAARRGFACIEAALERDRNHVRAQYLSGLLSSVQGEPGRANATFDRLLNLTEHPPAIAYRAYNRCFLDQPRMAMEELRHSVVALNDDSSMPIYLFFQGFSEAHCGDFDAAIGSLRRSLHVDPTYGSAKVWLAGCEYVNGNTTEARRQMDQFRAACPDYTIAEFETNWGAGRTADAAHLSRTHVIAEALRALDLPHRR